MNRNETNELDPVCGTEEKSVMRRRGSSDSWSLAITMTSTQHSKAIRKRCVFMSLFCSVTWNVYFVIRRRFPRRPMSTTMTCYAPGLLMSTPCIPHSSPSRDLSYYPSNHAYLTATSSSFTCFVSPRRRLQYQQLSI